MSLQPPTAGEVSDDGEGSPCGGRSSVVVIGYGNPLREDDGVGWAAVELLRQTLHDKRVRVVACHQLTPELAEPLSAAGAALFIDARVGAPAGHIDLQDIAPDADTPTGVSHTFTPGALLALARHVYGRCPPAQLATVTSGAFGYAEALSPAVQAALPELVARVRALLPA